MSERMKFGVKGGGGGSESGCKMIVPRGGAVLVPSGR